MFDASLGYLDIESIARVSAPPRHPLVLVGDETNLVLTALLRRAGLYIRYRLHLLRCRIWNR